MPPRAGCVEFHSWGTAQRRGASRCESRTSRPVCARGEFKTEDLYNSTSIAVSKDLKVALSIAIQRSEFENSVSSARKTFVSLSVRNERRTCVCKYSKQTLLLFFRYGLPRGLKHKSPFVHEP